VGRLEDLVRAVTGGRGSAVWVEGEPGIGKSALLAEGLAHAEAAGCRVFRVAAEELGQRFPLRVLLDCLEVVPGTADPARQEILDTLRPPGTTGATSADPVPVAAEGLLALVDRLCAASPVVLVVDDLQWADEASLQVWHRLGRHVRQLPLLLVTACRPVPRRPELIQLHRSMVGAGAILIELEPLPAEPVASLVGCLLRADEVGTGLRRAVGRAAGNPLYVREMVDALGREQRLRVDAGTVDLNRDDDNADVPVSLAAAISNRLDFVTDEALGVLRTAALLGTDFLVTDLAVLLGRPASELAPVVEETTRAGVLVESGVRLAFRHPLIRQVLADSTPTALRLSLHNQAARALAEAGAPAERTAQQLLAALPETDAAQAVDDWVLDWLAGAGRPLVYRAPKVAAELLSRAVQHPPLEDPRREDLRAVLAWVLLNIGRREEALQLADQIRATTPDPDRAAEMTWTAAFSLLGLVRPEQAGAMIDEELARPGTGEVWSVRLRALRPLVAVAGGDVHQVAAARDAVAEAERVGDRLAAGYASNALCGALHQRGDTAGAVAVLEHALATLGDDPQTTDLQLLMQYNRVSMLGSLDRLSEADIAVPGLLTTAERRASPYRLTLVRCGVAEHYYQAGHWDEAAAVLETLAEDFVGTASVFELVLHGLWALIAARRDDEPTAKAQLAAVAEVPNSGGEVASHGQHLLTARSVLAERRGDPGEALAVLAGVLDASDPAELTDRLLLLPLVARLAVTTGDTAAARAAVAAAAGVVAAAVGDPTAGKTAAASHCRGLVDSDPVLLLAAADAYRAVGRPVELATALEDASVVLAEHGDLPAARAAYAESVTHYTALDANWDLRRAESRLRPYGIRRGRSRRPAATGWAALTPSELTVAHLVAEGSSNPDIAGRLFLSRRTVDVHVSHILAKLAVRSRVDIAREAMKHRPAGARAH
jgi:DNA-binding NarL/FixJ family response regulator